MSAADDNNKKKKQTSNIGWILSLTKEEKLPLTVGITGMTIASAMNVVFPRIMGKAIDVASGKPGSAARASWWWCSPPSSRDRLYKVLLSQELAFYNNRKEVQDLLLQHELPFVVFYTGLFAEFLPHFLGYHYDEGYMTVVGKGETAFSITSRMGVGRFVAHVLSTAPKSALEGAKLAFEAERLSPLQIRDLRSNS
ncbi:hypothetical protein PF007_g31653 [Phytophthora fragariae]|uniref:Uncharacterized protein n=2 Tax=Phytophthora TaxID=4783 RepID=A0A6A3KVS1_9STRA|nr:hypothetical protein PR002_g15549 [Phytophthora rubi]KAE9057423.1 hypothetical protein PF007_g31653 [Phytophthora fragariae]